MLLFEESVQQQKTYHGNWFDTFTSEGTGFYSLNPCCLWLHTNPAWPSRCVKVSV
ncbi:hypothetical protein J4Q44_G00240480 [Coregonus suidteri]|uniref:Uncharacterized protein n=1 Tax=Coregonus suidteri TaxID=861788 RepID=A0AAN8QP86_9TELE